MDSTFYIYNYLNKSISISSNTIMNQMNPPHPRIIAIVKAKSKKNIEKYDVDTYFSGGNSFNVHVLDEKNRPLFFLSSHTLDYPKINTIKSLHVGMVTSRWVGSDGVSHISPGANAVQGLSTIKIHNKTSYPLSLNENIIISPDGIQTYRGREFLGVRLGTIFRDQDDIFPDFIFSTPATDLYYGITSDIQQSLFGGFQLTPDFIDSEYEPHYLLEKGWMGGEASTDIKPGFLPLEGKPLPPMDRWGRLLK
jgi:hypothetical protein